MKKEYKQIGSNPKYPDKVEIWKYGWKVPEWLSDRSKINAINSIDNSVNLEVRETSTGGFELLDSSGNSTLVRASCRSDYICLGDKKIFSLTNNQFNLLYKISINSNPIKSLIMKIFKKLSI